MGKRIAGWLLAAAVLTGGVAGQQDSWSVLTYPDPEPGVPRTYCIGLNERGDAVGYRVVPNSPVFAFLFSEGSYHDLVPPQATQSYAFKINGRGDIVGDYWVGSAEHGMLITGGEFVAIDLEGHAMAHLRGINNRGDIVGFYMTTPTSLQRAFLLQRDGTLVEVQYPNSRTSYAYGINSRGAIVGAYTDAAKTVHGYLRTVEGEFVTLDYPLATQTEAWDINERGEVVGFYWDSQGISHAFRWHDGEFVTDDYPAAVHTMLHGVNARGDTCGMMSFSTGTPIVWGGFVHTRSGR